MDPAGGRGFRRHCDSLVAHEGIAEGDGGVGWRCGYGDASPKAMTSWRLLRDRSPGSHGGVIPLSTEGRRRSPGSSSRRDDGQRRPPPLGFLNRPEGDWLAGWIGRGVCLFFSFFFVTKCNNPGITPGCNPGVVPLGRVRKKEVVVVVVPGGDLRSPAFPATGQLSNPSNRSTRVAIPSTRDFALSL